MRKAWTAFALGALLAPSLAFAADAPIAAAAGTAEQDIQCAAWAAYMVTSSEDDSAKAAYGYALTYFLGLYEGRTGKKFEAAMLAVMDDFVNELTIEGLGPTCFPRMRDIGKRMVDLGGKMTGEAQ